MQANPTADPWLGAGEVYIAPVRRVRDDLEREFRIIRELCEFTFESILNELARATPETAPVLAEQAGLDVHTKFHAFADVFYRLAGARGREGERMIRNVAEYVAAGRGRPEKWLPKLDGDALAYWRSVAHLWIRLGEERVPPPRSDDARANDARIRFASLQQVLTLLGVESHDVSPAIQEAIAAAYWKALVSVVPPGHENLVEDAFVLGQHEQSLLEIEQGEPAEDWHTVKAELSLG